MKFMRNSPLRARRASRSARLPARAAEDHFILNWVAGGDHAPYYYAKKMGWYKDAGIDLDFETGRARRLARRRSAPAHRSSASSDMAGVLLFRGKGAGPGRR